MQKENHKLTWHTYSDHLKDMMREMMTRGDFTDVTLVSHSLTQTKAHRNILSACSPVFKTILEMNTGNHPVIYLRGIQHSEIEAILHFLYLGKVDIQEERLNDLFQAAKDLDIKSLNNNIKEEKVFGQIEEKPPDSLYESNANHQQTTSEEVVTNTSKFECPKCKKLFLHKSSIHMDKHACIHTYMCDQCDYQCKDKTVLKRHIQTKHEGLTYDCKQCEFKALSTTHLSKHVKAEHQGIRYECKDCDYDAKQLGDLKYHVRSVHDGIKQECNKCDYKTNLVSTLRQHIKSIHLNVKYDCNECDYQATQAANLRRHKKLMH